MNSQLKVRRTTRFLLSATALATGIAPASAAYAQTTTTPTPSPATVRDDDRIEEIIVTAEKRSEGLQNIPIAITAVSGETLEKAGVKEVADLVQLTPSLQFGTRSTNIFIAMRGIGQAGQDIGSQSGVTVSLDGVPLLNHFMMNPAFLDVERVEVLRGPQGTIAGRNATGGAINLYTKQPVADTNAGVAFTYGNYDRMEVKGFVNTPISDTLLARVSAQAARSDGWFKNGFTGFRNDSTDLAEVRGQVLFTPSSALRVRALVDYTRDFGSPSFNVILGRADPTKPTPTEVAGYPFPVNDIENLTFYGNEPNRRKVLDFRATLSAEIDLSPSATLTSTTGLIDHDIRLLDIDVDLTPRATSRFDLIGLYARQFTQEFTLAADIGDRTDLIAGLFYMHGDSSEPLYLSTAAVKNLLVYLPSETLDSYAGYAQFRYNLTERLRATVGARYTIDEKSYDFDATNNGTRYLLSAADKWKAFTPRIAIDFTPNDQWLVYASASRGFKSGGFNTLGDPSQGVNVFDPEYVWNYEIGAKATLLDRKLRFGLTGFYADYTNLQATVFRINEATGVRFPKVDNSSTAKIKGVEFEFEARPVSGLRLTGAATWLDAKYGFFCNNDPVFPGTPTAPECAGILVNGNPLPAGATNLEGNQLTQAPKWQFSTSGEYNIPVSTSMEVFARADYKWQSRVYFDIYNNVLNSQDSYGLLNASLGFGRQDKMWSLTAFIRNAFDQRYISSGVTRPGATPYTSGSIGQPRMYGTTLDFRF